MKAAERIVKVLAPAVARVRETGEPERIDVMGDLWGETIESGNRALDEAMDAATRGTGVLAIVDGDRQRRAKVLLWRGPERPPASGDSVRPTMVFFPPQPEGTDMEALGETVRRIVESAPKGGGA